MTPDAGQPSLFDKPEETAPSASEEPEMTASVLSVEELNRLVRNLLQDEIGTVWVEGELSGIRYYRTGGRARVYGTIKDSRAEASIVIWDETVATLRFDLEDGMKVLVQAEVTLYPQRGQYQLVIRQLKPAGIGELELAFQQLKERLEKEGLFDSERKRPVPEFPFKVGVVTSMQAAALQDFLDITERRNPALEIVISPSRVQGEGAATEIVSAIEALQKVPGIECIVVTRGGGSLEDLWPFNEEIVARAIAKCTIPVVSAIGHEIDWTISDWVADQRTPTPSAAAELLAWPADLWKSRIGELGERSAGAIRQHLSALLERVGWFSRAHGFQRMSSRIREQTQRMDEALRMLPTSLRLRMEVAGSRLRESKMSLSRDMATILERNDFVLDRLGRMIDALGPMSVLQRGYAIVRRPEGGSVVRAALELEQGDALEVYLSKGMAGVRVESTGPGLEVTDPESDAQPEGNDR